MLLSNILLFLGGLGMPEMILILLIVILLFGAKKIPELARGLGRGIREFKDASKEIKSEIDKGMEDSK
jgi:sec-independent protein translocase protein TatA